MALVVCLGRVWVGAGMRVGLRSAFVVAWGGGGDGRFGVWLGDSLERGVNATGLAHENELLSEEQGRRTV